MVVGAPVDPDNNLGSGSAYIYNRQLDGSWLEAAKLTASDGESGDRFGLSVSISGDTIVIGAPFDNYNGSFSGSAYVFQRIGDTWGQVTKLTASDSDGASNEYFGHSVSISGETVVIGAYRDTDNVFRSGSAYIYERDVAFWPEVAKLTPSDGESGDSFGRSVSISDDTVVIGAWLHESDNVHESGSAYIYERDSDGLWPEVTKLTPSNSAIGDRFGYSVSVSGDTVVIGTTDTETVYVFEHDSNDSWLESAQLTASDGANSDLFGYSVAISGDTIVIGAFLDTDNDSRSGSAYIYKHDSNGSWLELSKLTASDGAYHDYFGSSVSISGETVVIGAYGDDEHGDSSGTTHVYELPPVLQRGKLTPSDGMNGDYFGNSVSISADTMVVGAYLDDDNGDSSGSAYLYQRQLDDSWSLVTKLTVGDGAPGDHFGTSVSISGDTVVIGAPNRDELGSESGKVYIYERDSNGSWLLKAKLLASDGNSGDYFGGGVSISGHTIVVGAYGADDGSGSAYVIRRDSNGLWLEVSKLTASDGQSNDLFGLNVSISGDTIVIGAYLDDYFFEDQGSAYIYERDSNGLWPEVAHLQSSDGYRSDTFGSSVGISGDTMVIGASRDDDNGDNSGSAYLYERDQNGFWLEVSKLTASDGQSEDKFGESVSISSEIVVIGAYADDDNGPFSGSAYIYERNSSGSWPEAAKLTPFDAPEFGWFGYSVSNSGDTVVVGTPTPNHGGDSYTFQLPEGVGIADLLLLLQEWGDCADPASCPYDLDDSGDVDTADLQALIFAWGGCP
jgi:hypothetical protein